MCVAETVVTQLHHASQVSSPLACPQGVLHLECIADRPIQDLKGYLGLWKLLPIESISSIKAIVIEKCPVTSQAMNF